jgi:hypothetical protein
MENEIRKGCLILTGYKQWSITRADGLAKWQAFIQDADVEDTGAPLFEDYSFESLIQLLEAYECGLRGGE